MLLACSLEGNPLVVSGDVDLSSSNAMRISAMTTSHEIFLHEGQISLEIELVTCAENKRAEESMMQAHVSMR